MIHIRVTVGRYTCRGNKRQSAESTEVRYGGPLPRTFGHSDISH